MLPNPHDVEPLSPELTSDAIVSPPVGIQFLCPVFSVACSARLPTVVPAPAVSGQKTISIAKPWASRGGSAGSVP